jgi:hypothetical protein
MENTKEDQFAREVLNESIPEWIKPDFNKILMDKIQKESRKKDIIRSIDLYSTIFVTIDAILFVLLNLMHIRITDIPTKLQAIFGGVGELPANAGQFILIYFVVLFAAILVISKISSTNYSLSKNSMINGMENISPDL